MLALLVMLFSSPALVSFDIAVGTVHVVVPGGEVTVTIKDEQATLEGPSVVVASGTINIDQLREYPSVHYAPALRGKDDL